MEIRIVIGYGGNLGHFKAGTLPISNAGFGKMGGIRGDQANGLCAKGLQGRRDGAGGGDNFVAAGLFKAVANLRLPFPTGQI